MQVTFPFKIEIGKQQKEIKRFFGCLLSQSLPDARRKNAHGKQPK